MLEPQDTWRGALSTLSWTTAAWMDPGASNDHGTTPCSASAERRRRCHHDSTSGKPRGDSGPSPSPPEHDPRNRPADLAGRWTSCWRFPRRPQLTSRNLEGVHGRRTRTTAARLPTLSAYRSSRKTGELLIRPGALRRTGVNRRLPQRARGPHPPWRPRSRGHGY